MQLLGYPSTAHQAGMMFQRHRGWTTQPQTCPVDRPACLRMQGCCPDSTGAGRCSCTEAGLPAQAGWTFIAKWLRTCSRRSSVQRQACLHMQGGRPDGRGAGRCSRCSHVEQPGRRGGVWHGLLLALAGRRAEPVHHTHEPDHPHRPERLPVPGVRCREPQALLSSYVTTHFLTRQHNLLRSWPELLCRLRLARRHTHRRTLRLSAAWNLLARARMQRRLARASTSLWQGLQV